MKNMRHPNFILGIVSILLVIIGATVKADSHRSGEYIIYGAVLLGAIHWIWGIVDVVTRTDMKPFQKRFWLIAVVAAPAIGALIFYVMHQTRDKLIT
jgi:hypothetical protein